MKLSLPVMQCDANCGKCCGPVLATDAEFAAIKEHIAANGITPARQGLGTCPLYQGGKCTAYEVRPFVCQMFGHSPKLVCPHGHNRNIKPAGERRLNAAYLRDGAPTRLLHELCYSFAEIREGLEQFGGVGA